jgi:hypothetical protein
MSLENTFFFVGVLNSAFMMKMRYSEAQDIYLLFGVHVSAAP